MADTGTGYSMELLRSMAMQEPDPLQTEYTTVARLLGVVAPAEEPAAPAAGVMARGAGWIKTAVQQASQAIWRASVTIEGADLQTLIEAAQRRALEAGFVLEVRPAMPERGVEGGVRPMSPRKSRAKSKR